MDIKDFISQNKNQSLVKAIGIDVIKNVAPEEMPIADALSDKLIALSMENKLPVINNSGREPGGFGDVDLIVTVVIPVCIAVLTNLLTKLGEAGIDSLKDKLKSDSAGHKQVDQLLDVVVEEQFEQIVLQTRSKKGRKKSKQIKMVLSRTVRSYLTGENQR